METSFADDLEADSIALFELVMAIEDEFEIEIEDDSIENISTVGDIVNYLEELLGNE
jgi:acyl carrier protein